MSEFDTEINQSIKTEPIKVPFAVRLRQFRAGFAPLIVFVFSLICLSIMWSDFLAHHPVGFEGRITAKNIEVKSPTYGQIKDVYVKPFQQVRAGDLLMVISKSTPNFSEAAVAQLKAEMELFKANQLNNFNDTVLRFQRLKLELLENKSSLASKRIEYAQSIRTYKRILELAESDISSDQDSEDAQAQMESLEAEVESLASLVENIQSNMSLLGKQIEPSSLNPESLSGFQAAFDLAEAKFDLMEEEYGPTEIVAPINGIVADFVSTAGRRVFEGDQLLSIESNVVDSIVAYIPEPISTFPEKGDTLFVSLDNSPKFKTQIQAVGAQIKQIPSRFSPTHSQTKNHFGLPIQLSLPSASQFALPGQKVYISY